TRPVLPARRGLPSASNRPDGLPAWPPGTLRLESPQSSPGRGEGSAPGCGVDASPAPAPVADGEAPSPLARVPPGVVALVVASPLAEDAPSARSVVPSAAPVPGSGARSSIERSAMAGPSRARSGAAGTTDGARSSTTGAGVGSARSTTSI